MKTIWKKRVALSVSSTLLCVVVLLLLEGATRVLWPNINFQGTELSLLRKNAFGKTYGWVPNSSGMCFGKRVVINEFGFRKLDFPGDYDSSWIILGDSVTFGVGVDTENTYAQLLQNNLEKVRIWNTSVIGYDVNNYKSVLNYAMAENREISNIRKVLLFFCLNDIDLDQNAGDNANARSVSGDYVEKALTFLRGNMKSYVLLKNTISDRSKAYFQYDFQLYENGVENFTKAINVLAEMSNDLRKKNVEFTVVILPYEYQLRTKEDQHLLPQKLLATQFKEKGISYIDAYAHFERAGAGTAETFLYADFSHFSKYGHQLMAGLLKEHYRPEALYKRSR